MTIPHLLATSVRRWYFRWGTAAAPWKTSPAAEKHIIIQYGNGPQNQGMHAVASGFGSQPDVMVISHVDSHYDPNVGPTFVRQSNTWYCYEMRVTRSSAPGGPDGTLEE